jgi:hypothetical protein
MGNWIDRGFEVPQRLETREFRLRMLTVNDLVKDYDAVMVSREDLIGVFGPDSDWPRSDMSLEQDLIDLGWHQKEFQKRSSFAYTVMALDDSVCLGCVYIYPTSQQDADAMVILWARRDSGIDVELFETVKNWIGSYWPFQRVVYPGRLISWDKWEKQTSQA